MSKLDELKRLDAGATASNWWVESTGTHPEDSRDIHGPCGDDDIQVCNLHSWNDADSEFIVAARNAMPALLRVVEAAKECSTSQVLNEPFIGYSEQFANLLESLKELDK